MSTTQPPALSQSRLTLALVTLFLTTFAMGNVEMVIVGIINFISDDLQVSIGATGSLVTAYALGMAIGGPVLTALTVKLPRRSLLIASLVLFLLGNLAAILGGSFALFVAVRFITGSLQGLFVGAAFVTAISISPPERIGRAISMVISGFAIAIAFGVPLGTLIGQTLGWKGSYAAITIFGALCLVLLLIFVPGVPNQGASSAKDQVKYALAPRVLAMLGLVLVLYTGQYAVLTYITPFLEQVTGINGSLISAFLLIYGVAAAIGSFGGGRFADKNAARTIVIINVLLVVALGFLYAIGNIPALAAVGLIAWGTLSFGLVPSLQYRIVGLAGPGAALAGTLPPSAINAGIAIGAAVGAGVISADGNTPNTVLLVGLIVVAVALPIAWGVSFLKPPAVADAAADDAPASAPATAPEPA
ncbi:MFS transporter [Saccharothrix obliqua]|uniref:MFS transporter n=1 Tax=Saccharothrix obliqua TaxID=2861747 RepID=UPI001C5D75E5|nr:MFS transporter [Saccharothrix obliqua]MBW4717749.1 MFS transporter [Saccharothrix obliqua]